MNTRERILAMLIIAGSSKDVIKPVGYDKLDNPGKGHAFVNAIHTIFQDDNLAKYFLNTMVNTLTLSELLAVEGDLHNVICIRMKEFENE